MKIYILGIGGTLMCGIAVLAKQFGCDVRGCDRALYPPMSTQLANADIRCDLEYLPSHLDWNPDLVIVGNAISATDPIFMELKSRGIDFQSGPEWLQKNVLKNHKVIAVSGTHGKTTTTAILVHLLRSFEIDCGYLIAGSPGGLHYSAHQGGSDWFVIEADEYNTSCFDSRAKFMHYHPDILLINNLEFDHADIFKDRAAVESEFATLVDSLDQSSLVIVPDNKFSLRKTSSFTDYYLDSDWKVVATNACGSEFEIFYKAELLGAAKWSLLGEHNLDNLRAALSVLSKMNIDLSRYLKSIPVHVSGFQATARRMQDHGESGGVRIIDDFAHHPTAIKNTITAVKNKFPDRRLVACVSFSSYSMRNGLHGNAVADAVDGADFVVLLQNNTTAFSLEELQASLSVKSCIISDSRAQDLLAKLEDGDVVLFMGNKYLYSLISTVQSANKFSID
jgi:UDP-N-acetylmuramate: L-alanyl-gamma-D-glutamyl-meso-diaminopimelate ligase